MAQVSEFEFPHVPMIARDVAVTKEEMAAFSDADGKVNTKKLNSFLRENGIEPNKGYTEHKVGSNGITYFTQVRRYE